jgi:hypothetical protein
MLIHYYDYRSSRSILVYTPEVARAGAHIDCRRTSLTSGDEKTQMLPTHPKHFLPLGKCGIETRNIPVERPHFRDDTGLLVHFHDLAEWILQLFLGSLDP